AARQHAILDDLFEHRSRERDGDRESDAERAARLRNDDAVDPDEVAGRIHERASGAARVDRGVGLDEILEAVDAEMVATERADDAERYGVAEVEGVADREHEVPHLHALERAERDGG